MPTNRIIPTLAILSLAFMTRVQAQEAPAPPVAPTPAPGQAVPEAAAPPTAAEKHIDAAIKALRAINSVEAKMKVQADMLNQKFSLVGDYKKAPDNRFYLLLTLVGLGDSTGSMFHVCDGVTRWEYSKVLDAQQCKKLTITNVFKMLNKPDCDAEVRETVLAGLGFAGPDALLAGLRKAFVFNQMREETLDGKPVIVLGGTWKDGKTPIAANGATLMPGAPLPPYVPGIVTLYLGKDDNWPYKVDLEGRLPSQLEQKRKEPVLDPTGRPISQKLTELGRRSRILLTYSDVKLNVTIPEETFAFAPPQDLKPIDETEQLLSQLEQLIAGMANRKKAEAAKAGGPVIDGSISAPIPAAPSDGAAKSPSEPPAAPK